MGKRCAEAVPPSGTRPSSPQAPSDRPAEGSDAEARELSAIFDALKGQAITVRIQRYEQYAQAHPVGRFTRVLLEEANALRHLQSGRRAPEEVTPKPRPDFNPPQSALA